MLCLDDYHSPETPPGYSPARGRVEPRPGKAASSRRTPNEDTTKPAAFFARLGIYGVSVLPVMIKTSGQGKYLACHDCDTLFEAPVLNERERVLCPNCHANLFTYRPNSVHRASAFAMASAVLFFVANIFPFLSLRKDLRANDMLLYESVSGLVGQGYPYLAIAVAVFLLAAPTLLILGLLYLLLPLLSDRRLPAAAWICRGVSTAKRWNMTDVYLVGVLVSFLKLGKLAQLTLGISFWAYIALIVCLTAAVTAMDNRELWTRLESAHP